MPLQDSERSEAPVAGQQRIINIMMWKETIPRRQQLWFFIFQMIIMQIIDGKQVDKAELFIAMVPKVQNVTLGSCPQHSLATSYSLSYTGNWHHNHSAVYKLIQYFTSYPLFCKCLINQKGVCKSAVSY